MDFFVSWNILKQWKENGEQWSSLQKEDLDLIHNFWKYNCVLKKFDSFWNYF